MGMQNKAQLNGEIETLAGKFAALQQNPATRVPADVLARARGIVLITSVKGGLIYAYRGGDGVALVRDASGHWGAPAFVSLNGSSLGFQAGGEKEFNVALLMTQAAANDLVQSRFNFGAGVGGTAGTDHGGAKISNAPASVLMYNEHSGLFGGASVKGGEVSPDKDANAVYYGKAVSMDEILVGHHVQPTPAEDKLIAEINQYSK